MFRILEAGISATDNEETVQQLDTYAAQELIGYLQKECGPDEHARLAKVEWGFLPVLDRHRSRVRPAILIRELSESPELFVELRKVVYCGANSSPREQPLTEGEKSQYRHAHDLLQAFTSIPGTDEDGRIDELALAIWTRRVRELAEAADRIGVADLELGRLFVSVPKPDGFDWPPEPLCRFMEQMESEKLYGGFRNGILSVRGIRSRLPTTGGDPERELPRKYRRLVEHHHTKFPNLARSFDSLAKYYDPMAER